MQTALHGGVLFFGPKTVSKITIFKTIYKSFINYLLIIIPHRIIIEKLKLLPTRFPSI
jgi:hypothetical protein